MPKTSLDAKTCQNNESKTFLQKLFGVDRWCTVYEEDEGFKLLADLSLCMYFGCGKKTAADDDESEEVPKVVSVANSDDYDCSDTISDICDDHHCKRRKDSQVQEGSSVRSRKPDPPSTRSEPNIISLVHPPPPPSIDTPSTERHKNMDESSRVAAHYESREALEDSDAENIPPTVVVGRRRRSKRRTSLHREDVPVVVYQKERPKTDRWYQADEYSGDEEYPADEQYPVIVYSDDKSSVFGYV